MIRGYDDLTPDALAPLGFDDPARACRLLQDMAGHDVPDAVFDAALRPLLAALDGCADPDRAVANLARWTEAVGSRVAAYRLLAAHPPAAGILVTVLAASQFFADLLIQTPEYLEALTNSRLRRAPRPPETMYADMARRVLLPAHPNARRDALRRVKGPEVLRIGVRDLLGEATFAETVADISAFADASVRLAHQICLEERGGSPERFAVLALGKLGGRELNYSSDIDLVFVHGDDEDTEAAVKLGEALRDALAKATAAGFVFRVDLRLRPEGRFGALSRSLAFCRAYYEAWAEPWERQALMKARCVAGDASLGDEFVHMTQAFVYPPRVDEAFVDSIRAGKRRLEGKVARAGEAHTNVKEGIGGIRDVEFAVQLMQLVAGGANPALRTGNTLEALARLTEAGLLAPNEQSALRAAYIFMRTVEHRLQLLDEQAIRTLPGDAGHLRKLARRLGYPDAEAFMIDYRRHAQEAHALFVRLFYGMGDAPPAPDAPDTLADWALAESDPAAQDALRDALAAHGIADTEGGLRLIRRAVQGSEYGGVRPGARDAFARLLPALLDAAGATADPDGALRGFDALADAVPSREAWYASLRDSPRLLPRLAELAGNAPALWQILLGHLEFLDMLADEEQMDAPRVFTPAATPFQMAVDALRARLHIGARDVWGLAPIVETLAQTTRAAEAALRGALALAADTLGFTGQFAVIGLGKLGGEEMAYASDMDVLYVADAEHLTDAARLAERLQRTLREDLAPYGIRFEIDARLRPEGRKGALVLDRDTYRAYYTGCPTWERQMLIKARPVAGDEALGQAFAALAEATVYAAPADEDTKSAVRAMKRRMETERVKDPEDIKLGPGGLSDIEWTTQLLQMTYGATRPRLRRPGTLPALLALRDDAYLTQADWEVLSGAYTRLSAQRNRAFLRSGVASDVSPALPDGLRALRRQVRAVCRRVFYAEPDA